MPDSSDSFAGHSTPAKEDSRAERNIVRIHAHIESAAILNKPYASAFQSPNIIDARSIFSEITVSQPRERKHEAITVSSQIPEEVDIESELKQFDSDSADYLRANPCLIPVAFDALYIIQDFLDSFCDIKAPIPLDDLLDKDVDWRRLMRSVNSSPMIRKICDLIRDAELEYAHAHIAWIIQRR